MIEKNGNAACKISKKIKEWLANACFFYKKMIKCKRDI